MKKRKKCSFGLISIRPDGINELDPCLYEEIQVIPHCTVRILKCIKCGHEEIEWEREGDYDL